MKSDSTSYGISSYLKVGLGFGCLGASASGSVVFYGDGATVPASLNQSFQSSPYGISVSPSDGNGLFASDGNTTFTAGSDITISSDSSYLRSGASAYGSYFENGIGGVFIKGATAGSDNYASISFNSDLEFEAVGQFFFDGSGGGYLIAIATLNEITDPTDLSGVGGSTLSISAGKALIDAVPEPSGLALLGLGSVGLLARRRRRSLELA